MKKHWWAVTRSQVARYYVLADTRDAAKEAVFAHVSNVGFQPEWGSTSALPIKQPPVDVARLNQAGDEL